MARVDRLIMETTPYPKAAWADDPIWQMREEARKLRGDRDRIAREQYWQAIYTSPRDWAKTMNLTTAYGGGTTKLPNGDYYED